MNSIRGCGFLDMDEKDIKEAQDFFKFQLFKNGVPDFEYFIQYDKFYLKLTFDLLK